MPFLCDNKEKREKKCKMGYESDKLIESYSAQRSMTTIEQQFESTCFIVVITFQAVAAVGRDMVRFSLLIHSKRFFGWFSNSAVGNKKRKKN